MKASRTGYLVIADISGYTAFLSESELEHARDSLNSLLELLVEQTRRPLVISRLEGDAVISYALDESVPDGSTLVDLVESTYVAFRRSIQARYLGEIERDFYPLPIFRSGWSSQEMVGTDVNLVHRLAKNTIMASTGIRAYAAYTAGAVAALGLDGFAGRLTSHVEQYEHIRQVTVFVQDLAAVWQRERESTRFEVRPEWISYTLLAICLNALLVLLLGLLPDASLQWAGQSALAALGG